MLMCCKILPKIPTKHTTGNSRRASWRSHQAV